METTLVINVWQFRRRKNGKCTWWRKEDASSVFVSSIGECTSGNTGIQWSQGHNCQNKIRTVGAGKRSQDDQSSSGGSKADSTSVSLCSFNRRMVLLETAVTTISNCVSEGCRGRYLLDKFSQQSSITEKFAARCCWCSSRQSGKETAPSFHSLAPCACTSLQRDQNNQLQCLWKRTLVLAIFHVVNKI